MNKNARDSRMAPGKKRHFKKRGGGNHEDSSDSEQSVDRHGNIRNLIAYSTDEEEDDSSSENLPNGAKVRPPQRLAAKKALKIIRNKYLSRRMVIDDDDTEEEEDIEDTEEEDEEEEDIEDTEEEDDEDIEDIDDIDDDDEDYRPTNKLIGHKKGSINRRRRVRDNNSYQQKPSAISISFAPASFDSPPNTNNPVRYNMKKESPIVNRFVELMTAPPPELTIDDQIDQFKSLPDTQQKSMIVSLERRPTINASQNTMFRILSMKVSPEIQSLILSKYNAIQNLDPSSSEYYKNRNWVDKAVQLPLGEYKDMPVRLEDGPEKCGEFIATAQKCLDSAIFGQQEAKLEILQFIASKMTNTESNGKVLLLVGPRGVGKTTLINKGIAKALGWPFQFISLGGDSDATTYTGHQLVYEGSHSGKIVDSLIAAKNLSMVLMFDEVDKISATPRGEEVYNLLIHLTDPAQNHSFEDKYLSGIPIDLSKVMFVFSANDLEKLDKILLDRFTVVEFKEYTINEKITIAEKYLWPDALEVVKLTGQISDSTIKNIITYIIKNYCNDEPGVRNLNRFLKKIAEKLNMLRMFNTKDLPFHIQNFSLPFVLKEEHIPILLSKSTRKSIDPSIAHMYH